MSRISAAVVVIINCVVGLVAACSTGESDAPPLMVIAVGQPGSVLNAVGTGVAKLVTEKTGTEMRVRVTSGMGRSWARVTPSSASAPRTPRIYHRMVFDITRVGRRSRCVSRSRVRL